MCLLKGAKSKRTEQPILLGPCPGYGVGLRAVELREVEAQRRKYSGVTGQYLRAAAPDFLGNNQSKSRLLLPSREHAASCDLRRGCRPCSALGVVLGGTVAFGVAVARAVVHENTYMKKTLMRPTGKCSCWVQAATEGRIVRTFVSHVSASTWN